MIRTLLLAVLLAGCTHPTPVVPSGASSCEGACDVLAFYKCEEAQPKKIGTHERTCEERCRQVESTGYLSLDPKCVVDHSKNLDEIRGVCNWECREGS